MPTATPPKEKRKAWPWIVAGVVVLIILLGIGAAVGGTDDESADKARAASSSSVQKRTSTTTTTVPIAALQAEVNAEVQRACDTVQSLGISVPLATNFNDRWSPVVPNSAALEFAVAGCVQQAQEAQIAAAGPIDVDAVIKDPDAVTGQTFIIVTDITQFDAATGACGFRGSWDNVDHEYSFEYQGDNAYFTSGDGEAACPALAGIDQNDVVRVWAKSSGSISYDTQIGGSTTAPSFDVLKAEIIRKA